MAAALLGLTLTATGRAHAAAPGPTPAEATRTTPLEHVILQTGDAPFGPLAASVAERVPGVSVSASEPASFERARGSSFVYIEVSGSGGQQVQVTAILPDGRAFVRSFVPDPADSVRSTAALIANLVAAIEQETMIPTRLDAALPGDPPPGPATESAASSLGGKTKPEPRAPLRAPAQSVRRSLPTTVPAPSPSAHALGVALVPEFLLPAEAAGLTGSGELSGMFRHRGGLLAATRLRYASRANGPARVHRARVSLAAGYAWRHKQLQISVLAGATVEPWWVTDGGQRSTPTPRTGTQPRAAAALLGGAVQVAPALHLSPDDTRISVDLGARAGFALSAQPSGADVRIERPDGTQLFALGGAEFSFGLWAAVWFPLGTHGRTRSSRR